MHRALRLFPGYDAGDLEVAAAGPFLLSRLLEDGDGADLARLFSALPEATATAWFAAHGGRQLSVRSRSFWQLVLGTPALPAPPVAAALWPL